MPKKKFNQEFKKVPFASFRTKTQFSFATSPFIWERFSFHAKNWSPDSNLTKVFDQFLMEMHKMNKKQFENFKRSFNYQKLSKESFNLEIEKKAIEFTLKYEKDPKNRRKIQKYFNKEIKNKNTND